MTKLLTTLVAAVFAATSFTAVAAGAPDGSGAPQVESKKSGKSAKKSPRKAKSKKAAKQ